MPKIVNKEEKRKEIISKAYEFILEKGVKALSTDALIKYMGIGKSSLYNYYSSKNEILYEVYIYILSTYTQEIEEDLKNSPDLSKKLKVLFKFYIEDMYGNEHLKDLYKESLLMSIEDKTPKMIETNEKLFMIAIDLTKSILAEEVNKGRIKKEALVFGEYMIMSIDGIFLYSISLNGIDIKQKIESFIDIFIELVELKKEV